MGLCGVPSRSIRKNKNPPATPASQQCNTETVASASQQAGPATVDEHLRSSSSSSSGTPDLDLTSKLKAGLSTLLQAAGAPHHSVCMQMQDGEVVRLGHPYPDSEKPPSPPTPFQAASQALLERSSPAPTGTLQCLQDCFDVKNGSFLSPWQVVPCLRA